MQTSFDAPRVASNNPFASYDPLSPPASSATAKPGLDASYFGAASSLYFDEPSGDPWSTSPTASTSTSTATAGGGIGARTSAYSTRSNDASNDTYSVFEAVVDDASLPPIYEQAFRAAVAYSSSNASTISTSLGTGGGTAARGGSVSLSTLHKVLSSCARLPASEVERVSVLCCARHAASPSSRGRCVERCCLVPACLAGRSMPTFAAVGREHEQHHGLILPLTL